MWRTRLPSILAVLTVAALTFWAARTALADGPAGGAVPALLDAQPSASEVPGQQSVTFTARLSSSGNEAVSGAPVTFYVLSNVFGERLMKVGEMLTDTTGRASLVYKPTWVGDQTVVVRYGGSSEYAPTQVTFQFNATGPLPEHENARFGLESVRRWAPLAVGTVVLAVWATLGLVMTRIVFGMAAAATAVQPVFVPAAQPLRPARLRPALALVVAVLLLALPGAWWLQKERGGQVSLSTEHTQLASNAGPVAVEPTPENLLTASEKRLPATLVRSIPVMVMDAGGQLTPGSADLPADVAKIKDRLYVLDTNRGRILTVASDGKLAPIFTSEGTGDVSLRGAVAMTVHSGQFYVASQTGDVVVLDPSGRLEGVIKPQVPAGQHPLRPAGIAVTSRGEIWLSDADNHRVLLLNEKGEFQGVIGEGSPSSGEHGFNTPGGLALEQAGNVYVADTLNRQVKKYSPMGVFLTAFGGDRLAEPRAVAVDETGNVFVTDDKLMAVLVFGPDGSYLGSIGSAGAVDTGSPSLFQAPHGLKVEGGMLYVMDRLAGLFAFRLEGGSGP